MMSFIPAYAIIWAPRSILSIASIATIVHGIWKAERTFDELGSKAFENANAAGLEPVAYFDDVSAVNKEELDAACPFPTLVLVGWVLFAVSNFIPAYVGMQWTELEFSVAALIACICSLCLGAIMVWPVRESYNNRNETLLRKSYQGMAVVLVALCGASMAANLRGPFFLCPFGILFMGLSVHRLYKTRKMGESWMMSGRPNHNAVVCSSAGPMMVLGWFLFFAGSVAIKGDAFAAIDRWQIPIYFNVRSVLAFVSIASIVCLTTMIDHAADESDDLLEGLSFVSKWCGKYTDLVISGSFIGSWGLYALAAFLPTDSLARTILNVILLLLCLMQGRAYGLLLQKSIPNHDKSRWTRLGRIIVIVFGFITATFVLNGFSPVMFSLVGSLLVIQGHKTLMEDRKKGTIWIDTEKPNPRPIVYSFGSLYSTTGWIMLAIAMSIPPW